MSNKEKYEGKVVNIYAPLNGRKIDILKVIEVIDDNCIYGESKVSGIETAYYLSDGIKVEIIN